MLSRKKRVPEGLDIKLFSKWKISNTDKEKDKHNFKDKKKDEINKTSNNYNKKRSPLSINWSESVLRSKWHFSYHSLGSLPSFVRENLFESLSNLNKGFNQFLILTNRVLKKSQRNENSNYTNFNEQKEIASILKKQFKRGYITNSSLNLEDAIVKKFKLQNLVELNSSDSERVGWEKKDNVSLRVEVDDIIEKWAIRKKFEIDASSFLSDSDKFGLFDSEYERDFINLVRKITNDETFAHWLYPQVKIDRLFALEKSEGVANRRIDFLLSHPLSDLVAIEIDGDDHKQKKEIDKKRDDLLLRNNVKTIRIPNDEIKNGFGINLNKIKIIYDQIKKKLSTKKNKGHLVDACVETNLVTQFQFLLINAINDGFLNVQEKNWVIRIDGDLIYHDSLIPGIKDFYLLLNALTNIYSLKINLNTIFITLKNQKYQINLKNFEVKRVVKVESFESNKQLNILFDSSGSAYSKFNEINTNYHYVIKPTYLPCLFTEEMFSEKKFLLNQSISQQEMDKGFEVFLQQIFRKRKFREGQLFSIKRLISSQDTVVLLPTGGGKSLIYQFSGLLMSGMTIIIDPIVALIKDQIRTLNDYGIDKCKGIIGDLSISEKKEINNKIRNGEYYYILISPERFQSKDFRSSLREFCSNSFINLAVIDEAHCVSEWGHDFRPAYLQLPTNIRRFCKSTINKHPTIVALTGTASRTVLKDIIIDLGLSLNDGEVIIRPKTFNRKEIDFSIEKTDYQDLDPETILNNLIKKKIPRKLDIDKNDFFNSRGKDTSSGIIFVPYVKGKSHSVTSVFDKVHYITDGNTTCFSGGSPSQFEGNWNKTKWENMEKFMKNDSPFLVATKAFGMGVDKQNIRFTIHFGVPSSIENFYQESGRAGRDKKKAYSFVIFEEFDSKRTDELLNPNLDLMEMKQKYQKLSGKGDDITRNLIFHINAFKGIDKEIKDMDNLIKKLGDFQRKNTLGIPYNDDNEKKSLESLLVKLLRVKIIDDYTIDWGGKNIEVNVNEYDPKNTKEKMINYISSIQPGIKKAITQKLENISDENYQNSVRSLAMEYIKFSYDHIEKSRRGMLRESVNLARSGSSNEEIRSQILNYLQDGLDLEEKVGWSKDGEVDLAKCIEILEKITNQHDAHEIREKMMRLNESLPNDPVVHMLRGLSEGYLNDPNERTVIFHIQSSIKNCFEYAKELDEIESWLVDLYNYLSNKEYLKNLYVYAIQKIWIDLNLNTKFTPTFLKDNNNIVTVITDYKKAISNLEKNIDLYKNQVSSLKI